MHYFVIIIIIVGILAWQISSFCSNRNKLDAFNRIFPSDNEPGFQLLKEPALKISSEYSNAILDEILSSLNDYLKNNRGGVSDFHLMKDIIDRNCDAKEEEIQIQIPVPLYLGLAGTMFGILIGVGFLVFTGGLNDLLNSNNSSGADSIETLLGGVALAMLSSISGLMLTTWGSHITKNSKTNHEKNKNNFLNWIQARLLPNISSDISGALVEMTRNLSTFNETFVQNTEKLQTTLSEVNTSYKTQAEMLKAIKELKIQEIVTANIDVYEKLKNSSNEIGVFAEYLENSNDLLANIQSLNKQLDLYENRTQIIENAGNFFSKNEKWLAENFDAANLEVREALDRFQETTVTYLTKLQESRDVQLLDLNKFMDEQQDAFKNKLQETSKLVEELKNLTHIKEGIKHFKDATDKQTRKIEELAIEIRELAKIKTDGGQIIQKITFPVWIKGLIIMGSSLFVIVCLIYLGPVFLEWINKLIN